MNASPQPLPVAARDHRVDFYRGIALAMIFVNHIPGNLWERYTSRNFGFSDAAEIFVFLAGFASAYAYGKGFLGGLPLIASLKAWRRAGVLYLVHIALTSAALGMFAWAAFAFGDGRYLTVNAFSPLLTRPLDVLVGLPVLSHQFGYVNILPMYAVILLMTPLLLLAAKVKLELMLVGSLAFWFAVGQFRLNIPAFPFEGGWFFNPLAWQLLFACGLYGGLSKLTRGYSVGYSPLIYAAALVYLLISFLWLRFGLWGLERHLHLPFPLGSFDKTYLSAPRLLHVLALVYVFAFAPKTSPIARIRRENPFAMLGRHSLPVFAAGTLLSLAAQIVKFGTEPAFPRDTAIILAGLAVQFALARYLDWWREAKQAKPAPPAEMELHGPVTLPPSGAGISSPTRRIS